MNIEAAKAVLDEMDGECGDMYDGTITLNDEWYRAHIQRVRDALEEEPQGDAVAMREALKELQSRLVAGVYDGSIDCHAALAVVEKALATPPRNCDVGNPVEQAARFNHGCFYHHTGRCSRNCERKAKTFADCILKWAGRPYTEGGTP